MNTRRKLLFFGKRAVPFDPDAAAYIARVETADKQSLEPAVKTAINDFVVGVKADGDWSALKASCILAGARTLDGALEPLVGTAPTSFNFVSGDYNRKTGLKGDGTTKYLNSNRANNADPQNDNHNSLFVSEIATASAVRAMGSWNSAENGANLISGSSFGELAFRSRTNGASVNNGSVSPMSLVGMSRKVSTELESIRSSILTTSLQDSSPANAPNITIYQSDGVKYANMRSSFYSIGESINLSNLNTRVTALMNAINTAI